jgi:hypothetical protein
LESFIRSVRVEHELPVDMADAGCADRAHEGHARNGQRGGSRDHADDVGSFSRSCDSTVTTTWVSFL